jgi:phosphoglucomutase
MRAKCREAELRQLERDMHAALSDLLEGAVRNGKLSPQSRENIALLLSGAVTTIYGQAVLELAGAGEWDEVNDRFFRTLSFGTGGLRGRTIGQHVTNAERGNSTDPNCPEHPCVGTNAMNFFNISRATRGLAEYVWGYFLRNGRKGRPKVVICHDTRFYSRSFAEFTAKILSDLGCDALLFKEFRSTPQLSFAIRLHGAQAGINITASHNPPAYNGYKVYFEDGGQIVEPHASGIIDHVRSMKGEEHVPLPVEEHGKIITLGEEVDRAYLDRLESLIIEPQIVQSAKSLRFVFSPLHGTGAKIILPLFDRLGFQCSVVGEQNQPDGSFPTVKSPNPEAREALDMAIAQAEADGADIVLATDPDADRMGVAVRGGDGAMHLLTGNQIGSILAWHRTSRLFEAGILNEGNRANATLIKTYVTTDLQKAIAGDFGIRCVETLTGFKYIGAKLAKYEGALTAEIRREFAELPEPAKRDILLRDSTYFIFGGEESYGYGSGEFVRDKDANSAAVMLAEAAAYAHSQGKTLLEILDGLFLRYGYFLERGESITLEGADGATRIARLVESYAKNPPGEMAGRTVHGFTNFAAQDIVDSEGDLIPKESMILFELEGGFRVAVRPSGTEPKIKFYLFGVSLPSEGRQLDEAELPAIKERVARELDDLWSWVRNDMKRR